MRIFHVTVGQIGAAKQNGVLAAVAELCESQSKIADVECICFVKTKKRITACTFSTKYFRFNVSSLHTILSVGLAQKCIFHLHGGLNVELHILALLLRFLRIPYCVSAHGAYSKRNRKNSFFRGVYIRRILKVVMTHAVFLHVFGGLDRYLVDKLNVDSDIFEAPNGVRFRDFTGVNNQAVNQSKILKLGFCGRVSFADKGLDLVPEILLSLISKGHEPCFSLIGEGPDLRLFKSKIESKKLNEYVNYHGPLYSEEKFDALLEIDVFIHPSRNEGMPLAPLEALMAQCKLVLSVETNLNKYLQQISGVQILQSRDPDDWADACIRASKSSLDNDARDLLFREKLSWDVIAKNFVSKYSATT